MPKNAVFLLLINSGVYQFIMGGLLMDFQAVKKPSEFTEPYFPDLFCRFRPFERVLLQSLLPQAESAYVPVQYFNDCAFAITENKQMAGKKVKIKAFFYEDGKPVYGFSHIGVSQCQVDPSI